MLKSRVDISCWGIKKLHFLFVEPINPKKFSHNDSGEHQNPSDMWKCLSWGNTNRSKCRVLIFHWVNICLYILPICGSQHHGNCHGFVIRIYITLYKNTLKEIRSIDAGKHFIYWHCFQFDYLQCVYIVSLTNVFQAIMFVCKKNCYGRWNTKG